MITTHVHVCQAKACDIETVPARLMCIKHWRMVPRSIQTLVWDSYVVGQADLEPMPSPAWHRAADAAIEAVAIVEGRSNP